MRYHKASLWLSAALVLGGCPNPEEPRLDKVTVSCAPTSVVAGQTAECTASATDQDGQPFAVSAYTWTSNPAAVAQVDPLGKVTTSSPVTEEQTVTISASASADGVTLQGQAALTVQPKPTFHTTPITTNETWRTADNPHVVRGALEVTGSATTLTLEPGVVIRFEQDAELRFTTGALKAMGTSEAPIRMTASQSAPAKGAWRGVVLAPGSASEMNYVTLSHCGAASGEGACIALKNLAEPVLRHVTVQNSGTAGVVAADDGSAFGTGSTTLSISGSTSHAVRIGANQAGTLPAGGTFTGNAPDAIELRGNVSRSQTWPNLGIPYVVNDVIDVWGPTTPTLTIPAGTVLRFGLDKELLIGSRGPGELIVDGTAASPVLFTADSASPKPGDWGALALYGTSSTRISHATFEYGGLSDYEDGAPLYIWTGARALVDNVIVQKSRRHGVFLSIGGAFSPGSTMLTSRDNGAYAIAVEANFAGTLPTGGTFTGNAHNAVRIEHGAITTSQTWPNLGIPYEIPGFTTVGSTTSGTRTTLTLTPGTELRFNPGAGLNIGGPPALDEPLRPGALRAEGTPSAPILFVPKESPPTKGSWRGLHFWDASGSRLDSVVVSHAGSTGPGNSTGTGNINLYRNIHPFLLNSTLSDSSGCGLAVSDGTQPNTENVTDDHTFLSIIFSNNDGGNSCKI